jgi:hypothetical protein
MVKIDGWGCCSVVECLLSMCETLGSILSTEKKVKINAIVYVLITIKFHKFYNWSDFEEKTEIKILKYQ